jgi:phosphate-selective porin OprO and OprP
MANKHTLRAAVLAALALPLAAQAQDVSVQELLKRLEAQEQKIQALEQKLEASENDTDGAAAVEEQQQKIAVIERRLEIQDEAAASAKESAAVVSAGPKGFSLRSADGKNQLRLRGTLHLDGRYLQGDDSGVIDSFQATRVRPTIEGTFGGRYDFRFMPDFGQGRSGVQDAYVTAKFHPAAQLTVGKFKSPVGLERLQGSGDMRWVQRGFPTALVPNRDIGIQLGGDLAGGRLTYQAAFLNGSNDGASSETFTDSDVNDDKEYALRLFAHPFAESDNFALRGLGIGIAGTYTDQTGSATQSLLPAFRSPGQATFFRYRGTGTTGTGIPAIADGERTRIAPQLYYYAGAFGLLGEYTEVSQDVSRALAAGTRTGTVDTDAWQLAASWFLTGEEAAFRGFQPKTRFSPSDGAWGAFEVRARVQSLSVSDDAFAGGADSFADPLVAARRADSWGVGLNWYLNENLKWVLDYERTTFEGGAATGDRPDEDAIQLRLALGF